MSYHPHRGPSKSARHPDVGQVINMYTNAHERILRRPEVEEFTGLRRSTIYDLIKRGTFPQSVQLTGSSVGWRLSDVESWIASRPTNIGSRSPKCAIGGAA